MIEIGKSQLLEVVNIALSLPIAIKTTIRLTTTKLFYYFKDHEADGKGHKNLNRRSIYQSGSQAQENLTFEDENNATFHPNVESTRLMQNTLVAINNTLPLSSPQIETDKTGKLKK